MWIVEKRLILAKKGIATINWYIYYILFLYYDNKV